MPLRIPPALRHRQFRLLWLGLAISVAGTQMQVWALFWHIRTLTDQPIALGGVGLARILPLIIFSLIGGAVADVSDRRRILFVTQSILAALAFVLAGVTFRGTVTLWQIYVLTALQASAMAFDLPARQSLVPNLVPARDLPNAFSMQSIAFQTGAIVGPALAGLMIARVGQPWVYVFNGVSYLAVILALILIGAVAQQAPAEGRAVVSLSGIAEGVRFIWRQPIILSTMLLDFAATFFSSANTLMPIIARDVLGVGVVEYGWLSAAQAVGAVAAGVAISQLSEIRRQGPVLLVSVVVYGLATIVFGMARAFPLAMLALIVVGGADAVSTIIRNTIRQLQTPDHIRGRMTSVNQVFFMGGPQLGEVEAGLVAQLFGAPFAVITGGIGCIAAVAWVARRWPGLAHYDTYDPTTARATSG
jgi:MFS family permease